MALDELNNHLKKLIKTYCHVSDAQLILNNLKVNISFDANLGDYNSNILFLIKKYSPQSEELFLKELYKLVPDYFEKIEIVNNFVNFFISKKTLIRNLTSLLKSPTKFFQNNRGRKQKIMVEFVSANPTGPLTLGNGRSASFGDALANILKLNNYRVTKEYYVNDRGRQIEILGATLKSLIYNLPFKEEYYQGEYLKDLAKILKKNIKIEMPDEKIGQIAAKYILENQIKKTLKNFNVRFDNFFFESDLYKDKKLVEKVLSLYKKQNLLKSQENAIWLELTKVGEIKDEVLIKSDGSYSYFLSDILYHYNKFYQRKFKTSINILGADHLDHARRLKKALELIGIPSKRIKIIIYQLVNIKQGEEIIRMSKRKGVFVTLDDILSFVDKSVLKFFFLRLTVDKPLILDLELMKKENEENPAWYLKYAYVRFYKILTKAKKLGYYRKNIDPMKSSYILLENENFRLIVRELTLIKDLLKLISSNFEISLFINKLINLSKLLHSFYEKENILKSSDPSRKIKFVEMIVKTLDLFFDIIGIEKIKEMYKDTRRT